MGSKKNNKNVNENEDLLEEVQRLRMENEYLKKLNALVQERIKHENKKKMELLQKIRLMEYIRG